MFWWVRKKVDESTFVIHFFLTLPRLKVRLYMAFALGHDTLSLHRECKYSKIFFLGSMLLETQNLMMVVRSSTISSIVMTTVASLCYKITAFSVLRDTKYCLQYLSTHDMRFLDHIKHTRVSKTNEDSILDKNFHFL